MPQQESRFPPDSGATTALTIAPPGTTEALAEFANLSGTTSGAETTRWRVGPRYSRARAIEPGHTIVHFTSEYSPYARTGGLGEAVAGLASAQARAGHTVAVLMPLYAAVRTVSPELTPLGPAQRISIGELDEEVGFFIDGKNRGAATVIFVDAPAYFDRPGLYGEDETEYPDNCRRFSVFTRAALHAARQLSPAATVFHGHDWHTGLMPVYARTDPELVHALAATALVTSVHNAGYQGRFAQRERAGLGVASESWASGSLEAYGDLNLLKAGVTYSDAVVTVSPSHARELLTEMGGFGLAGTFRDVEERLYGICNGIDESVWDPATDEWLQANYSRTDLRGKAECKAALQRKLGLAQSAGTPLFAMSARLVEQKGVDLVLGSAHVRDSRAQFAFLGHGERRYREALEALASERPGRITVDFEFTDPREHALLAGADFVLMPSLYEPCGLTQLRAQRYGAPVIARSVGGLRDTIVDGVTGLLFDEYSSAAFDRAIDRAESVFESADAMSTMRRNAMSRHFGWRSVAEQYAWVYDAAMHRAAALR